MDAKTEKIALFRYGLIAPLVIEVLPRGEMIRRARDIAANEHEFPYSNRTQVSVDTLLIWARRYRLDGFPALAPKPRCDSGVSRVIPPQLAQLIERLKRENPHRTAATLLRELALSSGSDSPPISMASLYRFLKERGLTERELLNPTTARRKFEAEYANQIWQSDMLYGPYVQRPEGGKRQSFLYAIIDDASRLIPHAQFYLSEGLDSLLDCLRQGVKARGIPIRLYVDNGKVFHSQQLARIAASLGILIVHSPPYQPEGRGKIERWFRTVREQFLANLDRKQTLTVETLNARFWAWIDNGYHVAEHSSLGTTPLLRWQRDIQQIRQVPPATDVRRLFFYRVLRTVRRDSTFLLQNRFYEAPPHLAGQRIEARFDPLDAGVVDIYVDDNPEGQARPVDPVVNAGLPRPKSQPVEPQPPTGINYVELIGKPPQDKE
ncbi:MAG: DDE-type integrase/transposase/recombinase [Acidobacteria bacterium]|nr:DDE-type integrase/transposase/recombinase [Acidobacteriota bacterium]